MADRNAREFLGLQLQKADKYMHSVDYLQKKIGINKDGHQ